MECYDNVATGLAYDLKERPPARRSLVYGLQWVAFMLAYPAIFPVALGPVLGLDQAGIAVLAQNTLFLIGLAALLQILFGHGLPIPEGPSGMWWGVFVILAGLAPGMGKSMTVLRANLEAGLLIGGAVVVIIGVSGLMGQALKLFTPAVTGTVLILLGLQLSGTMVKGMFGVDSTGSVSLKAILVSVVVVLVVFFVSLKAKGFLRSVAILAGIVVGWLLAILLDVRGFTIETGVALFSLPVVFAWGTPVPDVGIIITGVVTGLLSITNLAAGIMAMEKTLCREFPDKLYNRGVTLAGVNCMLSGAGSAIGNVAYTAAAGMVALTGVASRLPFIVYALIMILLGLMPPVGAFLSSIPLPVGYAVILAAFIQIMGLGFKEYARTKLDNRVIFVVGSALLVGVGVMFLPAPALSGLPVELRSVVGNGFIMGMLIVITLEHLIMPASRFGSQNN